MTEFTTRTLAAIEDADADEALVRVAAALAAATQAQLHLAHVFAPGPDNREAGRITLERCARLVSEGEASTCSHLIEGVGVTDAIQSTARECGCNLLVMGWRHGLDRYAILTADNLALSKSLDVDTIVFMEKRFRPVRRILVPTGGGGHSIMGLQVADALCRQWGAEMRVLRIAHAADFHTGDPLLQKYCRQLSDDTRMRLELLGIDAPIEIVPSVDMISPILERADESDLLVLGASNDWRQEEHLAGSIPDEIASRASCSVLMVRSRSVASDHLSDIFWEHTIRLDMKPANRWEAIDQMVDILVHEMQVPASERDSIVRAAHERERQSSTAIGRETAIPHAPIPDLPGVMGALGICPDGVDFSGQLVRYIFLLLTPQQNYRSYIPILAQIATLMRADGTGDAFLKCQTPAELTALIKKCEEP